jgi:hypothetical protein
VIDQAVPTRDTQIRMPIEFSPEPYTIDHCENVASGCKSVNHFAAAASPPFAPAATPNSKCDATRLLCYSRAATAQPHHVRISLKAAGSALAGAGLSAPRQPRAISRPWVLRRRHRGTRPAARSGNARGSCGTESHSGHCRPPRTALEAHDPIVVRERAA